MRRLLPVFGFVALHKVRAPGRAGGGPVMRSHYTPSDRCPETCPDSKFLDVVHSDFVRRREHDQVRPLENEEQESHDDPVYDTEGAASGRQAIGPG